MASIGGLPVGIFPDIHEGEVKNESAERSPQRVVDGATLPPKSKGDEAKRAINDRSNFMAVHCKGLIPSAESGCQTTGNTISDMGRLYPDAAVFKEHVGSLLGSNRNIAVDFDHLSPIHSGIVLEQLIDRAKDGKNPLHHLRFSADIDRSSPELIRQMNETIDAIGNSPAGAKTAFEFKCRSHNEVRTDVAELAGLRNITYIDLAPCKELTKTPDFSDYPKLTFVNLSGCGKLEEVPDLSNNPALRTVFIPIALSVKATLNMLKNPPTSISLPGSIGLKTASEFSDNPKLRLVVQPMTVGVTTESDSPNNHQ